MLRLAVGLMVLVLLVQSATIALLWLRLDAFSVKVQSTETAALKAYAAAALCEDATRR